MISQVDTYILLEHLKAAIERSEIIELNIFIYVEFKDVGKSAKAIIC